MNLPEIVEANSKKLNYKLEEAVDHELNHQARAMGYEPLGYSNTYEDKSQGILVQMPEGHNKYNNGVYMFHLNNDGQYLLEVVVPNTSDKGNLIRHLVGEITTFVENLDTSDLDTYDFAEIYGFVIANTVVKHLANALFPMDKDQQHHFTMIYLSRFLAHVAQIHAGDENIREEAVNSDPYLFKMAMLGLTAEMMEDAAEVENQKQDSDDEKESEVTDDTV